MLRRFFLLGLLLMAVCAGPNLSTAQSDSEKPAETKIVLIGHGPDHPYRTHCYLPDCELLAKCIQQTPGVKAVVSRGWPEDQSIFENASAVVLHVRNGGDLFFHPTHRQQAIDLLDKGIGLIAIHWGTGAGLGEVGDRWRKALGGHFNTKFSQYTVAKSMMKPADPSHPVCQGWKEYELREEYYIKLQFEDAAKPIAVAKVRGEDYPISWVFERKNGGRSFGFVGGHFHDNFGVAEFRQNIVNGILWTAKVDIPESGAPCKITLKDLILPPEFEKLNKKKP